MELIMKHYLLGYLDGLVSVSASFPIFVGLTVMVFWSAEINLAEVYLRCSSSQAVTAFVKQKEVCHHETNS